MKHLERHAILTDVQHGFRAKRSTVTQLILTIHDMAKTIQENNSVHAAVLDFSKAFDKVPHKRLIYKLHYCGVRGPLSGWIESFCAAWDPYLQKDINSLERVQRKAARFCTKGYNPTASDGN